MTETSKETGKLKVDTNPKVPVLVYVDNTLMGASPLSVEIPTGLQKVSFGEVMARSPSAQDVTVVADNDTSITGSIKLSPEEDVWQKIDIEFTKAMGHAEHAYLTNYIINLIIVVIGIAFLVSSLGFAIFRGLNVPTLAFAGIGITDFVALFLVNPQSRIQQLIGDLSQIVVIFRSWKIQMSMAENYIWPGGQAKTMNIGELEQVNKELNRATKESLHAIEKYIGRKLTGSEIAETKPAGKASGAKAAEAPPAKKTP
jgi:hypothetical protein